MRNLGWLIVLLVDIGIIALYSTSASSGDVFYFAVTIPFWAIGTLLIAVRFGHVPRGGHTAMKVICIVIPVFAVAGSLDSGRISGLEFYSIGIAMLFSWGAWKIFILYSPTPKFPINADTAQAPRRLP